MSDELKPLASIAGDMRFHALVMDVYAAEVEFAAAASPGGDTYTAFEKASVARLALITYINAWASTLVEEVKKDANRYRHIRETANNGYELRGMKGIDKWHVSRKVREGEGEYLFGPALDAAIDRSIDRRCGYA